MHVFKLALPFFAVVCGVTRGATTQAEPHVLCTGIHPHCFCAVDARNYGPTARWAVTRKCRDLQNYNFGPCFLEIGYPGFPPQAFCCDKTVTKVGQATAEALNKNCIMRDTR
ncbi:hypothetical protein PtB15_17B84 [Puccinia triticina]|nr:hypothetical protein PtB15_17B84 [Puccinia triticina]